MLLTSSLCRRPILHGVQQRKRKQQSQTAQKNTTLYKININKLQFVQSTLLKTAKCQAVTTKTPNMTKSNKKQNIHYRNNHTKQQKPTQKHPKSLKKNTKKTSPIITQNHTHPLLPFIACLCLSLLSLPIPRA